MHRFVAEVIKQTPVYRARLRYFGGGHLVEGHASMIRWRALAIAFSGLVFAILARMLFHSLGVPLHFATFLPAVLMAAFLAGVLGGTLVAVLAIPIVWWAFLPPAFEFNPLTPADYHNFLVFLLCSALLIWFAQLYREAVGMLRNPRQHS
jgi:K+-sensing histidine kinase KdpD